MHKLLTAYFTSNGAPVIGLTPTISIYLLHPTDSNNNTLVITNGATTEIGNGWYRYDFLTYDPRSNYVYTFDGGAGLPDYERYKIGGNEGFVEDISSEVWNEDATSHQAVNSTGLLLTQTKADTASISVSQVTLTNLINTLLKYEKNRTKIDKTANTLTIYEDDGTTVLTTFILKDHLGNPSVTEVFERMPQ